MKTKIIILAAMIAVAVGAQAQYGSEYYHRTGDTIETYSDIAYYKWWDFDYMLTLGERTYIDGYPHLINGTTIVATTYNTPAPLKIVGIACCLLFIHPNPYTGPISPEYLYLFDAKPEGPVYLDRSEIHFADSTPHRCLHVTTNHAGTVWSNDSCCGNSREEKYLDLYECYFDSGIIVTDSFHVGWSMNNYPNPYIMYAQVSLGDGGGNHPACSELDTFPGGGGMGSNCYFPYIDYMFCTDCNFDTNPEGSHTWTRIYPYSTWNRRFVLVYPLIEVDTTVPPAYMCEPVQNFQITVLDTGSGCVFFTWDDFCHYTYCEVDYYAVERGYSSRVTTTVTGSNMLHVCGLDSTLTYYARIRAYCDTSKIETAWSQWVGFTFPHSNPPQGIASEPTLLDRYTHVMPNPAADKVVVTSELGLRRIEVYNARGILVYSEPTGYSSMTIDLHGWPSGQYMMIIETREGKTAKKLVVQR